MASNFYERIAKHGTPSDKRTYAPREDLLLARSLRSTLELKKGMSPIVRRCEDLLQAANAQAEAGAGPRAYFVNADAAAFVVVTLIPAARVLTIFSASTGAAAAT